MVNVKSRSSNPGSTLTRTALMQWASIDKLCSSFLQNFYERGARFGERHPVNSITNRC